MTTTMTTTTILAMIKTPPGRLRPLAWQVTNFNLRVEQNKILEFFGSKSKDTISAADLTTGGPC
jgi:hypothetical protein